MTAENAASIPDPPGPGTQVPLTEHWQGLLPILTAPADTQRGRAAVSSPKAAVGLLTGHDRLTREGGQEDEAGCRAGGEEEGAPAS